MTEQPEQPESAVDAGSWVGPEQAPENVDTSPTEDDGPQDVSQDPDYEICESDDDDDDDDPEVHEVA